MIILEHQKDAFEQLAKESSQLSTAELIERLASVGFTSRSVVVGSQSATLMTANTPKTFEEMLGLLQTCSSQLKEGNLFIQANISSQPKSDYLQTLVKTVGVEIGLIEAEGSRTLVTGTISSLPLGHLGLQELAIKARSYIHTHPVQENGEVHPTPSPMDVANTFSLPNVRQAVATPQGIMEFRKPENIQNKFHFWQSFGDFFESNGYGPLTMPGMAPHEFYPLFRAFLIESSSFVREAGWEDVEATSALLSGLVEQF